MNGKKIVNISIALLIVFSILSGIASASKSNKISEDDSCDDGVDENVKEEVVGLSPDGKDTLMKRTTSHPLKAKEHKASRKPIESTSLKYRF